MSLITKVSGKYSDENNLFSAKVIVTNKSLHEAKKFLNPY